MARTRHRLAVWWTPNSVSWRALLPPRLMEIRPDRVVTSRGTAGASSRVQRARLVSTILRKVTKLVGLAVPVVSRFWIWASHSEGDLGRQAAPSIVIVLSRKVELSMLALLKIFQMSETRSSDGGDRSAMVETICRTARRCSSSNDVSIFLTSGLSLCHGVLCNLVSGRLLVAGWWWTRKAAEEG